MTKKDTILFITIFCVLALIAGSTYAYWGWSSNESKSVVFNTSKGIEDYVIYDAGESQFVGDFKASSTFCDGLHNTVTMSKVADASEMMLIGTLKMDVNSIENNMKSTDALGWAVVSGDGTSCTSETIALASGTFELVKAGSTLTLLKDKFIGTSATSYTVYIWLNTATASDALSGETLDVNIWTQVDQVAAWYGDVNLDGIVNFVDFSQIGAYVNGKVTLTPQQRVNADVNVDGVVDSADVGFVQDELKNPSASSMPRYPVGGTCGIYYVNEYGEEMGTQMVTPNQPFTILDTFDVHYFQILEEGGSCSLDVYEAGESATLPCGTILIFADEYPSIC